MRQFDAVILGSSPPLMSLALRLAQSKQRVLIIEKEKWWGGAWKTISLHGLENTDAYCHIFVQDFGAFKIMREKLGWDLQKVIPQPLFIYKGLKFHYNNPLRYLVAVIEPLFTKKKHKSNPSVWEVKNFRFSELWEFCRILWQTFLTTIVRRISYPKGAAAEILEKLIDQLKLHSVQMELAKKVTGIELNQGQRLLHFNGESVEFKKVYLSTGSEIEEVIVNGDKWLPQFEHSSSLHIYLDVKDPNPPGEFSYVYLGANPIMGRIYEPPNTKVRYTESQSRSIVVQLRNKYAEEMADKEAMANEVLGELKKLKILGREASLNSFHCDAYKSSRMSQEDLAHLRKHYFQFIQYMHVTNMSRGIHESHRVKIESLEKSHFRGQRVRQLGVEKLSYWLSKEKLLTPQTRVLDYGCGEFDLGQSIQDKVGQVDGYDVRAEAIERCKKVVPFGSSQFYLNPNDIPNKTYDLILLNGVVQYMNGSEEFAQLLKNSRRWISDNTGSQLVMTCIIEENYSPVRDALSWLRAAYKRKVFWPMMAHLFWGGWNTVIAKNNPTYVLSYPQVKKQAEELGWKCERFSEDLTYSDDHRATYILKPVQQSL